MTTIHSGPSEKIGSDASPGLAFLKGFLHCIDSLVPGEINLGDFVDPTAPSWMNGQQGNFDSLLNGLKRRSEMLDGFQHQLSKAWDIENANGTRTVMWESSSFTHFRGDDPKDTIKIAEFGVLELSPKKPSGLICTELRCYMDPKPIRDHMAKTQES